jgi:hypothetical protein
LKDENRTRKLVGMTNKEPASDKEIVQDLLRRMPQDASLDDIAQELEFIATIRRGLSELDENKDSISIEKVEPRLPSWSVTIGRRRRGRRKRSSQPKNKAGDSLKSPAPSPSA